MRILRLAPTALAVLLVPAPAAAGPNWTPPPPARGYSYPDCYCTNRGERVEMGQTACIRVGSSEYTAVCGMSLNNPAWRKVQDGCAPGPGAGLAPVTGAPTGASSWAPMGAPSLLQRLHQLQPG